MKPKRKPDAASGSDDVILLEDLAPTAEVRGGAGKLRFGQSLPVKTGDPALPDEESAAPRTAAGGAPRRSR